MTDLHAIQCAGPLSRRLPRVESVAVTRIVGSVGRSTELGGNFIPAALLLVQADVDAIVLEHYTSRGGTMSEE